MVASRAVEMAAQQVVSVLDTAFFLALAEPARVELIKMLLVLGPSDVGTLAEHLPQDRSVLSRHLKTLLQAGLVSCTRDGRHRIYQLRGGVIVERLEDILGGIRKLMSLCCPAELQKK